MDTISDGLLFDRIQVKLYELELEYKKEYYEMHKLYNEWPEGSHAAQTRMFHAYGKIVLLRHILDPEKKDWPNIV